MTTTTTTTVICTAWVQCPAIISRFYLPRNKNLMQWEKRKTAKKKKTKKKRTREKFMDGDWEVGRLSWHCGWPTKIKFSRSTQNLWLTIISVERTHNHAPTLSPPHLVAHSSRNFCDSLHAHTQAHTFYLQFCQAHWKRISTYINHLYAVDCPAQHPYAQPPTHFRHNKHKIKLQSNSINKLSTFSAAYA